MKIRKMSLNGHFYPDNKDEINNYINSFNKNLNSLNLKNIRALIVPHAGYIYSGATANMAYKLISFETIKRIIVIGPSHRVSYHGISGSDYEKFATPYGMLKIDQEYLHTLQTMFNIKFESSMHHEHSTEVQMPMIAHYSRNNIPVIELVYGEYSALSEITNYILNDLQNLLIISTDLSHFHDLNIANKLDNICIEAIKTLNLAKLKEGCQACGMTGVKAIIESATYHSLTPTVINYSTSSDITQDNSSVVGYLSVAFN